MSPSSVFGQYHVVPCNATHPRSLPVVWTGLFSFAVDLLGVGRRDADRARSDEELAGGMRNGDEAAFDELYERYFDRIYAFVARRVGHRQTAEDLVSDIFTKAFAHRRSFVWRVSFSAWIYRIATNRITDHYRTHRPTEELDETRHDRPSSIPSAPEQIDLSLLRSRLERSLETLSQRERMAVTMKYYGECDNGEIAEALGITANNVGVILHRALKKCQNAYE